MDKSQFNRRPPGEVCPFDAFKWEELKGRWNCSDQEFYHCLLNQYNFPGQICLKPSWVLKNHCPIYNTVGAAIDLIPCDSQYGACSDIDYRSNHVYKYSGCLNKTDILSEDTDTPPAKVVSSPLLSILIPTAVAVVVLILIVVLVTCLLRKRIKYNHRRRDEEGRPLLPLNDSKEPFYKSAAFHEGVNFIKNGGKLVCLKGKWGSGKTATANQIYMSVTNTPPKVIKTPLTFAIGHQPVIFDEAISKEITDIEMDLLKKKIQTLYENMSRTGTNPFIIITLNEDMEHCCDFVKSLVSCEEDIKFINLSKMLTKGDRTQILHSQFETYCEEKDFSKVEKLALTGKDHSLGYPEICALFCRCSEFQNVGPVLFCHRPLHNLASHLEKMYKSNDKWKFLLLVYMSLNDMKINLNDSNDMLYDLLNSVTHNKIRISSSLGNTNPLETGMSESADTEAIEASSSMAEPIKYDKSKKLCLESLIPREFVDKEAKENIYRLQHYVIKRMSLIVFGNYEFEKLLKFSKREDLHGWIEESVIFSVSTLTDLTDLVNDLKPVLSIKGEQWKQYQSKMV